MFYPTDDPIADYDRTGGAGRRRGERAVREIKERKYGHGKY